MNVVLGAIGSTAASGTFAALTLLLLVSWRQRLVGALLIVGCAMTAVWAFVAAVRPYSPLVGAAAAAELLRNGAWLLFLAVASRGAPQWLRGGALLIWAVCLLLFVLGLSTDVLSPLGGAETRIFGLTLGSLALALLWTLYSGAASAADKAELRFLVTGMTLLFGFDAYLYASSLISDEIHAGWTLRGYVAMCAAPFIAVSARRHAPWSVQLYVSRDASFYATTVGALLICVTLAAVAAYSIRSVLDDRGLAVQVALMGAGATLAALVFTPRVRRVVRVFLNKHFYRTRYDYRAAWLQFAEVLSTPRAKDGLQSAVIEAVARIVDSEGGLLWVQDAAGDGYAAVRAWPERDVPAAHVGNDEPCVKFIQRTKWIIDLDQHRAQPQVYDHVPMPAAWRSDEQLRLVIPLFLREELLGFVTLSGKGIRQTLNYEDHDLLKTVGSQIATYLRQDEIQRRLSVSQQFEAYHRLSAFMLHDLKNIIAQQSLVVRNAERHRGNPAFFDDAIATISNSVQRMNRMLSQFNSGQIGEQRRLRLIDVLQQSLKACAQHNPRPELRVEDRMIYVRCDFDRLAAAFEHLLRNAQESTDEHGHVTVAVSGSEGSCVVRITDDGVGMDNEFVRNGLFAPFVTTKGSQGMGIGAYQARESILAMGGRLRVDSTPGKGTVFHIELPLA